MVLRQLPGRTEFEREVQAWADGIIHDIEQAEQRMRRIVERLRGDNVTPIRPHEDPPAVCHPTCEECEP